MKLAGAADPANRHNRWLRIDPALLDPALRIQSDYAARGNAHGKRRCGQDRQRVFFKHLVVKNATIKYKLNSDGGFDALDAPGNEEWTNS